MAKFNVETTESGKSSVSVSPGPKTYRKGYVSATNPNSVGTAGPKKGHTEAK